MNDKKLYKVSTDNKNEYYVIANNYGDAENIIAKLIKSTFSYKIVINKIEYIDTCYYENN